jgi:hypothetical protein
MLSTVPHGQSVFSLEVPWFDKMFSNLNHSRPGLPASTPRTLNQRSQDSETADKRVWCASGAGGTTGLSDSLRSQWWWYGCTICPHKQSTMMECNDRCTSRTDLCCSDPRALLLPHAFPMCARRAGGPASQETASFRSASSIFYDCACVSVNWLRPTIHYNMRPTRRRSRLNSNACPLFLSYIAAR